ncbi:MAG: hypothetical protein ACK2T3_00710 [Candidatus Promineifilaceae bacterium]
MELTIASNAILFNSVFKVSPSDAGHPGKSDRESKPTAAVPVVELLAHEPSWGRGDGDQHISSRRTIFTPNLVASLTITTIHFLGLGSDMHALIPTAKSCSSLPSPYTREVCVPRIHYSTEVDTM